MDKDGDEILSALLQLLKVFEKNNLRPPLEIRIDPDTAIDLIEKTQNNFGLLPNGKAPERRPKGIAFELLGVQFFAPYQVALQADQPGDAAPLTVLHFDNARDLEAWSRLERDISRQKRWESMGDGKGESG